MSHLWLLSGAESSRIWDNPNTKWDNPYTKWDEPAPPGPYASARPSTSSSHASSNARWCQAL